MENQTQQVQSQPEQKKKWYKRLKIWIYITITLFILIVILALIAGRGMPILGDIPNEVTESALSVHGSGVESNVNVKLYVNGNEEVEVKANKEGNFNAELNLTEGENIIYAVAPYKDKLVESSKSKVKYIIKKQEEIEEVEDGGKQEEAKNAELLKEEQRKQEEDRARTEAERIRKENEENERKIAEEAERKEQEAQTRAEAEAQTKEMEAQKRTEMIESQFSVWNGSHRNLTKYIKDSMNDPKSYEHVETTYRDMNDYLIVTTRFRGKNAFGGKVLNTIRAKVSLEGEIIEILEYDY